MLLLPAWDSDIDPAGRGLPLVGLLASALRQFHRILDHKLSRYLCYVLSLLDVGYAFCVLFPVTYSPGKAAGGLAALSHPDALRIENKVTRDFLYTELFPRVLHRRSYELLYSAVALYGVTHAFAPPAAAAGGIGLARRCLTCVWRLALCGTTVLCLGVTLLPMAHIDAAPTLPTVFALDQSTQRLADSLQPFHVSTSYGLFRRMTGVGQSRGTNWGGVPASVVAVPAVVVEGSPDGGKHWREIPFRYAPFKPERAPRRTAPHQPRLDWQMWFAALGSYQHNPWFVHLIWKLLHGSDVATELLDIDEFPFRKAPPTHIRASLYHYDFTRLRSPWSESIHGVSIINATRGSPQHALWWSRKRVSEYIPTVDRSMLAQAAEQNHWRGKDLVKTDPCSISSADGGQHQAAIRGVSQRMCEAVVAARDFGSPLRRFVGVTLQLPPIILAVVWSGMAVGCFFDGPLTVILLAIAMPLLISWAMGRCRSGLLPRRATDVKKLKPPAHTKVE